jgi:hypothetical protein
LAAPRDTREGLDSPFDGGKYRFFDVSEAGTFVAAGH